MDGTSLVIASCNVGDFNVVSPGNPLDDVADASLLHVQGNPGHEVSIYFPELVTTTVNTPVAKVIPLL